MDFEMTKREIIASISILAIMFIIGIIISGKISDHNQDKNSKYNKAFKILNDKDMFNYAMNTNIGNSFVEGELSAIDTVNFNDEINGEFMEIKRVKEEHRMHTRTVTTTINGKPHKSIQTYWTWDMVDSKTLKSKELNFLGSTFNVDKFNLPELSYIKTIDKGNNTRYKYYGLDSKFKATIFADLKNNTIVNDNVSVYKDKTISETLDIVITNSPTTIFWIIWVTITVIIIYIFIYFENNWLNY